MDPTTVEPSSNPAFYTFEFLNALAAALQARSDLVDAERNGEMAAVTEAQDRYDQATREFYSRFSDLAHEVESQRGAK